MANLMPGNAALAKLLTDTQTALRESAWTTHIVELRPEPARITKGKWSAAKVAKLAKHYGEQIDSAEAAQRATANNNHILGLARHAIEVAAWIACTDWLKLLWSDKSKPYQQKQQEAAKFEAQKSFSYKEARCAMLLLQIEDTILKIEQTELLGVEHFGTYFVTRLRAEHNQVHRRITIYSRENVQNVISTSKIIELDGGALIQKIAKFMPHEARDKDSVVHKLAIGFAPSDEVFELWVQEQIDILREQYKDTVPANDLEDLLAQLRQKAFDAEAQHAKTADKVTAKDVAYFNELLRKELA
jgi:hypothetical protein